LFPIYLLFSFISTSLRRYNIRIVLLKTRAFWRNPLCRGSTGKVVRAPAGIKHRHNHGRRRRKCPRNTPHEALRLVPMRQIDGRRSPEQADIMLGLLRGCMALKALLCSGYDASPYHRSVVRAIYPLNPLKIVSTCSGGHRSSSENDGAGRNASGGALGGHFCRRRLWSAMVVMVVVDW
jgi:hypothetical protein